MCHCIVTKMPVLTLWAPHLFNNDMPTLYDLKMVFISPLTSVIISIHRRNSDPENQIQPLCPILFIEYICIVAVNAPLAPKGIMTHDVGTYTSSAEYLQKTRKKVLKEDSPLCYGCVYCWIFHLVLSRN